MPPCEACLKVGRHAAALASSQHVACARCTLLSCLICKLTPCSPTDEVRATLAAGGCPLPLITRAEQAYRAASHQARGAASGIACYVAGLRAFFCRDGFDAKPACSTLLMSCRCKPWCVTSVCSAPQLQAGFDGPLIVELTMLRLLVTIYQARGT